MPDVTGLHTKRVGSGSLPKQSVAEMLVYETGADGDYNKHRMTRLKGTPDQALLIFPIETIEELNDESWPVSPGDLGENITTRGILHSEFGEGMRLHIGTAQVQITYLCEPCTRLYELSYVDSIFGPEFIKALVGRRGWYARVVKPGAIRVGDAVRIIDD